MYKTVTILSILLITCGAVLSQEPTAVTAPQPPTRPADLLSSTRDLLPPSPFLVPSPGTDVILPWREWTPGDVRSGDKAEICGTSTKVHRHVTNGTKRTVGRRYRVARGGAFVYDHLIPLGVGGANTPENLWPEPRGQAKTKDVCENRARAMVCSRGTLTLEEAQRGFANNFVAFCDSIGVRQETGPR